MDLQQNYFALFSLPVAFAVDAAVLSKTYLVLQQTLHPDRFAAASAQEKRLSMQAASLINQAYQVLGDDLQRAAYMLSLRDIDIENETSTQVDPEFLLSQMNRREQIEHLATRDDPLAAAAALRTAIAADTDKLKTAFALQWADQELPAARDTARKWQFMAKLQQELGEVEYQLEETGAL